MLEDPDHEGVKQALARLLDWPEIARSPQLARFLSYIVERELGGEAQSIKAYSIAVDVFGRSADFDPQADPIVRVQARRLRALLDQYYLGPGATERLQIRLPTGRYVPTFVEVDPSETPEPAAEAAVESAATEEAAPVPVARRPRGHVTVSWFVLLVLAVGATALTYSLSTLGPRREQQVVASGALQRPSLRVMEFQNLTGDGTITSAVSALAVELVADFAPLIIVDASFGGRGDVPVQAARPANYVLSGVVRRDMGTAETYQFSAILTDVETNSISWNWMVEVPREKITQRGGIDLISQELIAVLGNSRGPLHARAYALLERSSIEGQENFYLCDVLFSLYRTNASPGTADRVLRCIDALPESEKGSGNVLAAEASLISDVPYGTVLGGDEAVERFARATDLLARALSLDATSSFVWEQRARLHEAMSMHEEAEAAYGTALQLNPANIDGLAAHARHMALTGRLDDAVPAARRAIVAVSQTRVPDWFQCVPAISAVVDGAFSRGARPAQSCSRADIELGPILSLLIAQGEGDAAASGQVLPQILEVPSFRDAGILTRLEERITDPALLERIEVGLTEAGVPAQSLVAAY